MKRFLFILCGLAFAAASAIGGWLYFYANNPLMLPATPFEFTVKQGATLKSLSRQLTEANLLPEPQSFWILGRVTDQATGIQAGTYRLTEPTTPIALLYKINAGDVVHDCHHVRGRDNVCRNARTVGGLAGVANYA